MSLKKLGAAMLVVAVLSAVLASSAFATATPTEVNWQKGESPDQTLLAAPMAVTTQQVGGVTIAFLYQQREYVVHATGTECLECQISNSPTGGSGTGKLKFTGVTVAQPAGCTTPSTITTNRLSFSTRYKEGETELVKFVPSETESFFRLELSEPCYPEQWLVKGSLFGKITNKAGVQAASQPVEFSPSINSAAGGALSFGGGSGSLTATESFKAGGTYFGVAPGGVVLPEATPTAAKWYTGSTAGGVTELVGSHALTAEQVGSTTFTTVASGHEYVVHATGTECLECQISNSPTGGSGTGKLKFTGVTVAQPAGCTTPSTITTKALTLAANWLQGEYALVKFMPAAGETKGFATLEINGCSLATELVPKGSLFGKFNNKQGVQATSQTVRFTPTINSDAGGNFRVGLEPATLTATDVFSAGGLFFGVK
jgi:hypothetical protein